MDSVQRVNEEELKTNEYVREVMQELEVRFSYDLLEFGSVVDRKLDSYSLGNGNMVNHPSSHTR